MRNYLQLSLILLFIGVLVSSCSTTNNLTSCPGFDGKKKAKTSFAFKTKKKNKSIAKKKQNLKRFENTVKVSSEVFKSEAAKPLNSIVYKQLANGSATETLIEQNVNLKNGVLEAIVEKLKHHNGIETSTASIKEMIDNNPVPSLEKLGIRDMSGTENVAPLTKKEIRKIKKEVKKEIKKAVKQEAAKLNEVDEGKGAAIVAYITWVGLLIALLAMHKKGNAFSAFHLRQSLGIYLIGVILLVVAIVPIIGWIIAGVGGLLLLINWLIGIIGAASGSTKPVFLFGNAFQNWFKNIN